MAVLVAGATTNKLMEVEANGASRSVLYPKDVTGLGSYSLGTKTGIMAAGLGAAAPIFSLRYAPTINPNSLMLVKKVLFTASTLGTAFTAGSALFDLRVLRGYTVADTGGGSLTLGTDVTSGKKRTSHAICGVTDFRISATATLSAGTQTADTNPIAAVIQEIPATTTNYDIVGPNFEFFKAQPGEHPLILAANEGLVIRATVPASGTWSASVVVDWDEVASY